MGKNPDPDYFEQTVLRHLDAAYNLARWLTGDAVVAEDAVQEASLRALRAFDSLSGPNPKAWFMAVVYRIREHPINLFVWRRADGRDAALDLAIVRGFSVAAWSAGGLDYAAVSDVDAGELGRFARELQGVR